MSNSDFNARLQRLEDAKNKVTSSRAESVKFVSDVAKRVKAVAVSKDSKK